MADKQFNAIRKFGVNNGLDGLTELFAKVRAELKDNAIDMSII